MRRPRRRTLPLLAIGLLAAACSSLPQPTDPDDDGRGPEEGERPAPVIAPAGPLQARVGTDVAFTVENIDDAVWSVDGVEGGNALLGTVQGGLYSTPTHVPRHPTVTVTASDPADPTRTVSAEVTLTAPGTLYVIDEAFYVFEDMDAVDNATAPTRVISLEGYAAPEINDLVVVPETDQAFFTTYYDPILGRIDGISTADGEVTFDAFDLDGYVATFGVAYDRDRDVLYVTAYGALLAFDEASALPAGSAPTRVIYDEAISRGEAVYGSARVVVDAANDRAFVNDHTGMVLVYDDVSTLDGETEADRVIELGVPSVTYVWGMSYDPVRDELYVSDQRLGAAVYVIADAATADGVTAPSRTIGGSLNVIYGPSQVTYDPVHDRLVVIEANGNAVKVYEDASTLDGDVVPAAVLGGSGMSLGYPQGGYLDPTR